MIKLKPIAEQVLNEADEKVTWGDVQTLLNAIIDAQKKGGAKVAGAEIAKSSLKKVGMAGAKWAANALTGGTAGVIIDLVASHGSDVGGFLLKLGKSITEKELKNPKGSESEELPNMDELLGTWLNDMGKLKDKADIYFKGTSGEL